MLTDYGSQPAQQRNILRSLFLDPHIRAAQCDWQNVARFVVGAFRADAARAGAEIAPLADELCRRSPAFRAFWQDHDVRSFGGGVKHLQHPVLGPLALEYSAFAVDGRPDLTLVVFDPATPADTAKVSSCSQRPHAGNCFRSLETRSKKAGMPAKPPAPQKFTHQNLFYV